MTRRVTLIFGRTGAGKSTMARKLSGKERRILILDPLGEFSGTVFHDFDTFAAYMAERLDPSHDFRIVCRFSEDVDVEYFFILARQIRCFTLCIDEAEIYLDPRSMNEDFLWIIRYGRHKEISLIAVARRVPELSVDLRAQASTIITFLQSEPRDLKNLEGYGFNPDRVRSLPLFQYLTIGEPPRI